MTKSLTICCFKCGTKQTFDGSNSWIESLGSAPYRRTFERAHAACVQAEAGTELRAAMAAEIAQAKRGRR